MEFITRMKTRGGKIARYEGKCPLLGRHRFLTSNQYVEYTDPKDVYTIWLVDDQGRCRGDLQPSERDIVGPA